MVFPNNKMFTCHDLITFTESIDQQQPFITIHYYMCGGGGEGYCELILILQIFHL